MAVKLHVMRTLAWPSSNLLHTSRWTVL